MARARERKTHLYLVGFTTDLKSLVFSAKQGAESGNYVVDLDDRIRRALEEAGRLEREVEAGTAPEEFMTQALAAPEAPPPPPPPEAKLSPREMQQLLRHGWSPDEVARAAGTSVAWVERFTGPILAERAGIVETVRAAWMVKRRLGRSSATIGEAVAANLDHKKVRLTPEAFEAGWSAVRSDGRWEVDFGYRYRGQLRQARFLLDPSSKEVVALNALAGDLGWRPEAGTLAAQARRKRSAAARKSSSSPKPSPAKARASSSSKTTRAPGGRTAPAGGRSGGTPRATPPRGGGTGSGSRA